jgi:hypothetical protein
VHTRGAYPGPPHGSGSGGARNYHHGSRNDDTGPRYDDPRKRRPTGNRRPRRDTYLRDAYHERPHDGGPPGSHHAHHYYSRHDESHNHNPRQPHSRGRRAQDDIPNHPPLHWGPRVGDTRRPARARLRRMGSRPLDGPGTTLHRLDDALPARSHLPRFSHLGGVFRLGQNRSLKSGKSQKPSKIDGLGVLSGRRETIIGPSEQSRVGVATMPAQRR